MKQIFLFQNQDKSKGQEKNKKNEAIDKSSSMKNSKKSQQKMSTSKSMIQSPKLQAKTNLSIHIKPPPQLSKASSSRKLLIEDELKNTPEINVISKSKNMSSTSPPKLMNSLSMGNGFKQSLKKQSNQMEDSLILMNGSLVNKPQNFNKTKEKKKLQKRDTVNSITIDQEQPFQLDSPVKTSFNRNQNNNYLSIGSLPPLPDYYQYRGFSNMKKKKSVESFTYSIDNDLGQQKCQQCEYQGQMEFNYKLGWVGVSWIIFLLLSTLILFWLPLVWNSKFKQKEVICPQCGYRIRTDRQSCL